MIVEDFETYLQRQEDLFGDGDFRVRGESSLLSRFLRTRERGQSSIRHK
jgi:hypothetical protein